MAKNRVYGKGTQLSLPVAAGILSGSPCMVGQIPGVALKDRDTAGEATIQMDGVFNLSVKGENNAGNVAVAIGDILYFEVGQTPPVNKDNVAGIRFGYALAAVTSGATATIPVKVGY